MTHSQARSVPRTAVPPEMLAHQDRQLLLLDHHDQRLVLLDQGLSP